ncbi:hypothetical protein AS156_14485 [Bradyrhizobium macuxiense]|uniref:Uncharacterized protein n=1 Tax=Bradyrhizobium macuxiense TaxID=1755647 RepID=A0A109JJZ3_9BRAD|nr:hypothetical protein [Bradyrhizobium macuxiense]KWV50170.1 hypothetical protein AS156_14485 [Bradyrhizobium macuxiense]
MLSDPQLAAPSHIPMDTIWSILEAANELGDIHTVDACRRVIDADLRGSTAGQSDVDVIAAFFA